MKSASRSSKHGVILAGIALAVTMREAPVIHDLGQCQQGLGAAEIAAEDHLTPATGAGMCGCGS